MFKFTKMTNEHFKKIKDVLYSDFDDFWSLNTFESELSNPNSLYFVCIDGDKIIGFVGIWQAIDTIHIMNIVTRKDFRNIGVANFMLKNIINFSQSISEVTSITLEVNEKNIYAIKLYASINFKKLGIRKKYYNNSEIAKNYTLFL